MNQPPGPSGDGAAPPSRRTDGGGVRAARRGERPWRLGPAGAALLLVLLVPSAAQGQASPTLPLDHPAHEVLRHLAATGAVPPFPRGEGVLTRAAAARLLATADSGATVLAGAGAGAPAARASRARAIRDLVERGSRGLEEELRRAASGDPVITRRPLHQGSLRLIALDSPARPIPANGLGSTGAWVNSLASGHQGRLVRDGTTWTGSTVHAWGEGGLSLQLHPFVTWRSGPGERGTEVGLHQAALRLRLGNLELRGGRDVLVREPWAGRGLVLSGGGRNRDLVEVGTAEPATLPWVLGLLGPVEARAFWAHLGRDQTFRNGWMVGYRGSVRPHPRVEVGGTAVFQQGGEGGPGASWGDRFLDALLIPDLLEADSDYLFSNKLVGMDLRVRLPWGPWGRGVELFGEAALDDFDHRRLRSSFLDNGAVSGGVFVPSVDRDGRLSLGALVQRTGPSLYRHNLFLQGLTLEGRPLGTTLGPDGTGGYLRLVWFPHRPAIVTVEGAWERYRADRYRVFGEPDFRYERIETLPVERRVRATARVDWMPRGERFDLRGVLGAEQVRNLEFSEGTNRTNLLAELGFVVRP